MNKRLKKWLIIFGVGWLFTAVFMSFALLAGWYFFSDLLQKPDLEILLNYRPPETTIVYDENWEELGGFAKENRMVISLSEMGEIIPKVFLTAEDKRFFVTEPEGNFCGLARWSLEKFHLSLDPCSLYRSVRRNLKEGRPAEGASTISQQLAEIGIIQSSVQEQNLTQGSLWRKKIRKAIIAYYIEKALPKEKILELWLNHMYLGNGNFGVEAASQWYWQKNAKDLTLPETALMAGLVRSPGHSPFNEGMTEKAKELRNRVLRQLYDDGIISETELKEYSESLLPQNPPQENYRFPNSHILEYVRRELKLLYDEERVWTGGLRIHTTLNKNLQDFSEIAVNEAVAKYHERQQDAPEKVKSALLIVETQTGRIKSRINSEDFTYDKFDRVDALRQPGSAFKAIVYTAAIANGSRLDCDDEGKGKCETDDVPTICLDMGKGQPKKCIQNYPYKNKEMKRYLGPKSELKYNLWESRNAGTICLVLKRCGHLEIKELLKFAKDLGIETPLKPYPTTAIGASEVTLFELTNAVKTIANFGKKVEPYIIESISDRNGKEIYRHKSDQDIQVIDEKIALQAIRGLRGVTEHKYGTAHRAYKEFPCQSAGKTGTATNKKAEPTDNWFIGFTPSYTIGGWMGFDKKIPLGEKETGATNILPIFIKIMNEIYKDGSCESFPENTDPFKPFTMKKESTKSETPINPENQEYNESD